MDKKKPKNNKKRTEAQDEHSSQHPAGGYLAKDDSLNNLLNDIHHDIASSTAAAEAQEVKVTQRRFYNNKNVEEELYEENLGEDFDQTPWIPPSLDKAKEFKRRAIYRGGNARLDSIDIVKVSDLGTGVTLYFQFALSMAVCLFLMTIFSIPALVFSFSGNNVSTYICLRLGTHSINYLVPWCIVGGRGRPR